MRKCGLDTLAAITLTCLALGGCAALPRHVGEQPSVALKDTGSTTLGRIVERSGSAGLSGIRLLTSGEEAFDSLVALADHAERTLDLQYYIIMDDASSRALMQHVRMAADRGVRVRILVDDLNTVGEDRRFMRLGEYPNVEVRIFNPFPSGRFALWSRFLFSAYHFRRINHRMHNKLFVADNAVAITGGRNIGDEYFTRDKTYNFVDLDVVAAGAIVPELSRSFDNFWNSPYSYPIASFTDTVAPEPVPPPPQPVIKDDPADFLARELDAGKLQLTWVPATVLADRPVKIASETSPAEERTIANDITDLMRSAKHEVIIISPYFVPGKEGVALFRELTERGVRIRILTNSLATTDAPLVDIGYARYRAPLLKLGVDLREIKANLGHSRPRFHPFRYSSASLHAKALVIDAKTVFIGSLNMDARSAHTNTELGIVIESTEIAQQVTSLLDDIATYGSYKLALVDHSDAVEWLSDGPGKERIWYHDPDTTLLQRLSLKLLAPFAPEELL